jgi:hypothetical protein
MTPFASFVSSSGGHRSRSRGRRVFHKNAGFWGWQRGHGAGEAGLKIDAAGLKGADVFLYDVVKENRVVNDVEKGVSQVAIGMVFHEKGTLRPNGVNTGLQQKEDACILPIIFQVKNSLYCISVNGRTSSSRLFPNPYAFTPFGLSVPLE